MRHIRQAPLEALKTVFIVIFVAAWVFSAWPQIAVFPLKLEEAKAAIGFVQQTSTATPSQNSVALAYPQNNAAGDLLIVAAVNEITGLGPLSVSDTLGNGYTAVASGQDSSSNVTIALWYAKNLKAEANTVTVSINPGGSGRNAIVILVETGLRPCKELLPMKKSQVDVENGLVYIHDSKTPSGIGELPISDLACKALKAQIEATVGSEYLFPTPDTNAKHPYLTSLKKAWATTLRRAGVPYFSLYELRHTFATRLSAGGVADHFVTQMLRQADSAVFKRYSQAKLNMMREALSRLDRQANEHSKTSATAKPN